MTYRFVLIVFFVALVIWFGLAFYVTKSFPTSIPVRQFNVYVDGVHHQAIVCGVGPSESKWKGIASGVIIDLHSSDVTKFRRTKEDAWWHAILDRGSLDLNRIAVENDELDVAEIYEFDAKGVSVRLVATLPSQVLSTKEELADGRFVIQYNNTKAVFTNVESQSSKRIIHPLPNAPRSVFVSTSTNHVVFASVLDRDESKYRYDVWAIADDGQVSEAKQFHGRGEPHLFNGQLIFVSNDMAKLEFIELETGSASRTLGLKSLFELEPGREQHWFHDHLFCFHEQDKVRAIDLLNFNLLNQGRWAPLFPMDHDVHNRRSVSYVYQGSTIYVNDQGTVYKVPIQRTRGVDVKFYDEKTIAVASNRAIATIDFIDWKSGDIVRRVQPFAWIGWAFSFLAGSFLVGCVLWSCISAKQGFAWYLEAMVFIVPILVLSSLRVWDGRLGQFGSSSLLWIGAAMSLPVCCLLEAKRRNPRSSSFALVGAVTIWVMAWLWTQVGHLPSGSWIVVPVLNGLLVYFAISTVALEPRPVDAHEEIEALDDQTRSNIRFSIYDVAVWTATIATVTALMRYLGAWLYSHNNVDFRSMVELSLLTIVFSTVTIGAWVVLLAAETTKNLSISFIVALAVIVAGCITFTIYADFYRPILRNEFLSTLAFLGVGPLTTLIACSSLRRRGYRIRFAGAN